jgi:hypothetical protein
MDDGGIRWKKKASENTIAHPTIEENERNAPEKKKRDAVQRPVKLLNRRGSGKATTAVNLSQPISNFFQLGQRIATNMNALPSSTAIGSKTTTLGVPPNSSRNINDKDSPTAHKWGAWKSPPNVSNNGSDVSTTQPALGRLAHRTDVNLPWV